MASDHRTEEKDIDPFGVHSSEYNTWWRAARRNGWKLPVNTAFPDESWLAYWKAMDAYAHGETAGRPVPPHRSGGNV